MTGEHLLELVLEELGALRVEVKALRAELAAVPAAAPPGPELVTVEVYAKARSLGESTVRRAIREGRLPAVKVGRCVRVPANAELGERIKPATNAEEARRARVLEILGGRS